MAAFEDFIRTEAAAEALKRDGVRAESILVLNETC